MLIKHVTIILLVALFVLTGGCTLVVPPVTQKAPMPETLTLPIGFRPEGIAISQDGQFFVGSLGTLGVADSTIVGGAIYRGDLATGKGALLVKAAENQMAVGLTRDDG